MKMNRLFEIIYILLEKKTVTAKELAQYFEVSVRTIYRDVEMLSQANIPLYTSRGKSGGIRLLESFVLNKSVLSKEERQEILWALQGVSATNAAENKETLLKLQTLFGTVNQEWICIDFSDWSEKRKKDFELIKKAITSKKVLEFDYYNSCGKKTHRQIEAVKLWFKDKTWYVKAFCKTCEESRLFKVVRMRNIVIKEETFQVDRIEQAIQNQNMQTPPMISIQLEIDASQGFRVYDEFEEEQIQKKEDGKFLVILNCIENEWVYSYILSYGDMAKVLNPKRIQKNIIKRLEKICGLYKE